MKVEVDRSVAIQVLCDVVVSDRARSEVEKYGGLRWFLIVADQGIEAASVLDVVSEWYNLSNFLLVFIS